MNSLVIFDTSVLADQFRTDCHAQRIRSLTGVLRNCSVVLSELWRGVRNSRERATILALEESHPVLVPSARMWTESGQMLGRMHTEKGFERGKLRDLHFDVLIALTARAYGARLITSNRTDFELIREYKPFQLEIWPSA